MPWPHALSRNQNALVSAALRHVADAAALEHDSPVQAFYLAGYGPECARKASLARWEDREEDVRNRAIGHRFEAPAETTLAWFCDLDPLASRYTLRNWHARHPVLREWKEEVRYGRSDSLTAAKVRRMCDSAEALTYGAVASLWADGRLEPLDSLTAVRT